MSPPLQGDPGPLDFRGREILAPMVRGSTLPLRLECLRYGADLVYGEEIVDKKIIGAARVENKAFGIVDYVSPRERVAVFTTCAEERARVFFQIGTASGPLATEAALLVAGDVRGVDVNMGCPKSFSVKGGMGAALLERPEVAADILKSLRRSLPATCAVTCKIRMLATTAKTRDFMQLCERSGVEAITLHTRTPGERPADPAHWDEVVKLWDAVRIPVNANGDFFTRHQINEFRQFCLKSVPAGDAQVGGGVAAVMVARGALWNPSIFCRGGLEPPPFEEVVRRYTRTAVETNNAYQNTKWVLSQILAGGIGVTPPTTFGGVPMKQFNQRMSGCKSMAAIRELLGEAHIAADFPAQAHTTAFYRSRPLQNEEQSSGAVVGEAAEGPPPQKRPAAGTLEDAEEKVANCNEDGSDARKRARLDE